MDRDRFLRAACGVAGAGGADVARKLLAESPDEVEADLFAAAAAGDAGAVGRLLDRDPSAALVTGGPLDGQPLLYACFSRLGDGDSARASGLTAVARLLLERGADPNARHRGAPECPGPELPALFGAAALAGNVALTRVLLEAGANPNDGESMFHAAARAKFDCLEVLLDHGGDLNDTSHPAANTPLHWMLDWSYERRTVVWLLQHGADPNVRVGPERETALHVAVRRRRTDAARLLLSRGAEIDARTAGGKTAYAHARRRGFDEVARLLARRGADTTVTPADELAVLIRSGDLAGARARICADPELVRCWGPEDARLLPDLAGLDRVDAVRLLLDAGAEITARGLDGGTALHQAAWFGAPNVARLLVERGAPIDVRGDAHDSTPLGWCAHGSRWSGDADERARSYVEVADLLLRAGASLSEGPRLLGDASEAVAEVLRRYGARD